MLYACRSCCAQRRGAVSSTMAAVLARRKPAPWRNAWCLAASVLLFSCVSGSSFPARSRGAFVTTLSAYSSIKKSNGDNGLQLPSECSSYVQAVARKRSSCRRSIGTTAVGATAAHMTTAAEGGEKELRLLTWMEVEARIEREIAEVRTNALFVFLSACSVCCFVVCR